MKITGIRCPACNCVVYSRARHDYRSCPCGSVSVDGGFDYLKVSHKENIGQCEPIEIELGDVSENDLYQDWNINKNQYGLIRGDLKDTRKEEIKEYVRDLFEKDKKGSSPSGKA